MNTTVYIIKYHNRRTDERGELPAEYNLHEAWRVKYDLDKQFPQIQHWVNRVNKATEEEKTNDIT